MHNLWSIKMDQPFKNSWLEKLLACMEFYSRVLWVGGWIFRIIHYFFFAFRLRVQNSPKNVWKKNDMDFITQIIVNLMEVFFLFCLIVQLAVWCCTIVLKHLFIIGLSLQAYECIQLWFAYFFKMEFIINS